MEATSLGLPVLTLNSNFDLSTSKLNDGVRHDSGPVCEGADYNAR